MNKDSIAGVMSMTLLFGAARADATPEQLQRLRSEALPVIKQWAAFEVKGSAVIDSIRNIMGSDWTPGPQWTEAIRNLIS